MSFLDGADMLNAHLKSDDFFLTKLFAEARFSFKNVSSVEKAYITDINYKIEGELSIRGITKKQTIDAVISEIGNKLILTSRVEIDKTRWNILYGSAKFLKFLGMHTIFDKIFIEMRLELE